MFGSEDWFRALIHCDGKNCCDANLNTESLAAPNNLCRSSATAHVGEIELILGLWIVHIDHSGKHWNCVRGESIAHLEYS